MMTHEDRPDALGSLRFLPVAEALFESLPDVVFFVKDLDARYITVNSTLVRRCGAESKREITGKTALEVFAPPFGQRYYEEDLHVLHEGKALRDLLELHRYVQGAPGWCVTTKLPLLDADANIVGLVGISNDIHMPAVQDSGYRELAEAVAFIQTHLDEPLRIESLASMCGLSVYQFEQRMKKVFQITAGQFITKTRIDAAREWLRSIDRSIADIALSCGFSDQSAFTRQFKTTTGLTPSEYRRSPQSQSGE